MQQCSHNLFGVLCFFYPDEFWFYLTILLLINEENSLLNVIFMGTNVKYLI